MDRGDWRTKPADRFILRWIKVHLSSRITPHLVHLAWLRPGMITVTSGSLGMLAGVVFGLGAGWLAALVGAASQVLDGVDGQYARLTGRESRGGAFLDSVIDRYASSAMIVGACVYLGAHVHFRPLGLLILVGFFALVGGDLISYTTARAASLGIELGRPTLISKGTRMTVLCLAAFGTLFWGELPFVALCYLALHANLVILARLVRASRVP